MEPTALDARVAAATPSATDLLVERAQRGEAVAFEVLLRDRLDGLFRTAWAILGDEADARDATQEACIAAWRHLPRLREPDRFDAWLMRIIVNACRGRLRSRSRSRVREIRIDPWLVETGPIGGDPAAHVEADAIARAFDRLDPDARSILVLHHLQHRPVAELAGVLGIPPGTVKSRLHTARVALATALERERR